MEFLARYRVTPRPRAAFDAGQVDRSRSSLTFSAWKPPSRSCSIIEPGQSSSPDNYIAVA
jgi:hypothetical protein